MEIPIKLNAPDTRLVAIEFAGGQPTVDSQPIVLAIRPQDGTVVALPHAMAEEAWAAGAIRGWEPSR